MKRIFWVFYMHIARHQSFSGFFPEQKNTARFHREDNPICISLIIGFCLWYMLKNIDRKYDYITPGYYLRSIDTKKPRDRNDFPISV